MLVEEVEGNVFSIENDEYVVMVVVENAIVIVTLMEIEIERMMVIVINSVMKIQKMTRRRYLYLYDY